MMYTVNFMNLVHCYIENNSSAIDQTYTYQFVNENVEVGKRVLVNFNGKERIAFVDEVEYNSTKTFRYEIKPILEVIDEKPILNEEMIELAKWMSKTTVSTVISALQAMVPSQLKPKSTNTKIIMERWVRPVCDYSSTNKQKEMYDF